METALCTALIKPRPPPDSPHQCLKHSIRTNFNHILNYKSILKITLPKKIFFLSAFCLVYKYLCIYLRSKMTNYFPNLVSFGLKQAKISANGVRKIISIQRLNKAAC